MFKDFFAELKNFYWPTHQSGPTMQAKQHRAAIRIILGLCAIGLFIVCRRVAGIEVAGAVFTIFVIIPACLRLLLRKYEAGK